MENKSTSIIFDKNTVEFVTVAAEFCGFLERTTEVKRSDFIDKALKLLPLLYLKASLLPKGGRVDEFDEPETFVTEGDYERIRGSVAALMGELDDYLDVFLDDMAFSDTPIRQTISENLADIYQVLKDFICVYQLGLDKTMNDALVICEERFAEYWGQCLVNAMRALHDVRYSRREDDDKEVGEDDLYTSSPLRNDVGVTEEDLYEGLDAGDDDGYGDRWE
ncbi:DUF5063 domain-containing protein [uncultured Bacteroides sp.]|uniref:DUF5063 domain-containing protein n=1 Tax=uncultured Bacteroides sp. TaxID=162156 RepID=UPI0026315E96|nr:DUF5063 domain-containing protein [uncultured Bacteroides sp.]